jgi:hypothetical protein
VVKTGLDGQEGELSAVKAAKGRGGKGVYTNGRVFGKVTQSGCKSNMHLYCINVPKSRGGYGICLLG